MGRIKSLMVKRAAKQLLDKEELKFTGKFDDNKKILSSTMPSKSVRNKIAGYLARLIIMKEKESKKQIKAKEELALQ